MGSASFSITSSQEEILSEARRGLRDKKFSTAMALLGSISKERHSDPEFLSILADASYHLKNYAISEQAARTLVELDPRSVRYKIVLGRALVSNGKPAEGKQYLLDAGANKEAEPTALRWLLECARVEKNEVDERHAAERLMQLHEAGIRLPLNALERAKDSLDRTTSEKNVKSSKGEFIIGEKISTDATIAHKNFDVVIPDVDLLSDRIRSSIVKGTYEQWEGEAAVRMLSGGERVMELGGGIGFISTVIGKNVKVDAYHIIEADPRLKPVIEKTHKLNGVKGFTVETCMVSSDPKEIEKRSAQFAIAGNFTASSAKRLGVGRREISVPIVSFDQVVREHRPDVLICDIEGSEIDLVEYGDFSAFKIIMVELHPDVFGLPGTKRIFERLGAAGFAYETKMSNGSVVTFRRVD